MARQNHVVGHPRHPDPTEEIPVTLLRNIPWYAAYAALAVALVAILIGAAGMAAANIPVCMFALQLLAAAGVLIAFAYVSWLVLERLGVL